MAENRYVVLAGRDADDPDPDALILRDGFSLPAFLLGPIWLLWHRLWLAGAAAGLAQLGLWWLESRAEAGLAGSLLPLLVSILIALEGPALLIARHRAKGRREVAALVAGDRREAELRYFAEAAGADRPPPPGPARIGPSPLLARPSARALGLFQGR